MSKQGPVSIHGRLHYMDAVRAFALLLGIAFHASLSFTPIYIGWAVTDVSTSNFVSVFMLVSHSFRMELFFLIAGFFSYRVIVRNGPLSFTRSRLVHIGIPFVIGWFLLKPFITSGWIIGFESMRGDADVIGAILRSFAEYKNVPAGLFIQTHLWFLYYLLLVTIACAAVYALTRHSALVSRVIHAGIEVPLHSILGNRFSLVILSVCTVPVLWFMQRWGVDTPDKSLIPHMPVFILYGACFLIGVVFSRSQKLLDTCTHFGPMSFLLCIFSMAVCVVLAPFELQSGHEYYIAIKLAFTCMYACMMWSLISVCMGLFKKLCNTRNALIGYISDASYWLYIVHLPIIIWLQVAVAELAMHWSTKISLIFSITLFIGLVSYQCFVRSTIIGVVLNGKRK